MAHASATCRFCGCTDDSIQVICESRCLICSRCQQVPAIRKLLVDHTIAIDVNPSTASQVTQTYLKGFCPVCECPMSSTMLSLISTFKELYRTMADDNKRMGRLVTGMELEEFSTAIAGFLKRYRATYEADMRKVAHSIGANAVENRFLACMAEIYDLHTTPTRTSLSAVMEFVADCYAAQWQAMLKNGRESMITTMMRLFNRKRFSQRTNDMRIKAVLDYLAAVTGSETPELLLFGRLIGLQPRQTATISPAWAHITACIFAASLSDRCLKTGQFIDITGQPSVADIKPKLMKMCSVPKSITLKRAIKIIELLNSDKQPFWVMAPLIPSCIEYGTKLPWDESSVLKLLNLVLFVGLFEGYNNPNASLSNCAATGAIGGAAGSGNPRTPAGGTNSAFFATPAAGRSVAGSAIPSAAASGQATPIRAQSAASGTGTPAAGAIDGAGTPMSGNNNTLPSAPNSPSRLSRRPSVGTSGNPGGTANGLREVTDDQIFSSGRVVMLRSLDALVTRLWNSSVNASASMGSLESETYFLANLHRHNYTSHLRLTFEQVYEIAEGKSISLSEFCYAMINCWDAEYATVKKAIFSGSTTFNRRGAICGHYDIHKAHMNAAERLCMTRLLHWFSDEQDFHGIDWHEVLINAKDRLFPFNVPESLLKKSVNELHYLEDTVVAELRAQRKKDALEDEEETYNASHGGSIGVGQGQAPGTPMTNAALQRFNRQQYLASQTVGYVDKIRLEDAVMDSVKREENKKHFHRAASMGPIHEGDPFAAAASAGATAAAVGGVGVDIAALAADMDDLQHKMERMSPHPAYGEAGSTLTKPVDNRSGAYGYGLNSDTDHIRNFTAGGLQRPLSPEGPLSSVPGGDPRRTTAGVEVHISEYHDGAPLVGALSPKRGETGSSSSSAQFAQPMRGSMASMASQDSAAIGTLTPPPPAALSPTLRRPPTDNATTVAPVIVGEDTGVAMDFQQQEHVTGTPTATTRHALSQVPFVPARHSSMPASVGGATMNVVDILDNDPNVLKNAGLLREPGQNNLAAAAAAADNVSRTGGAGMRSGGRGVGDITDDQTATTKGAVVNGTLLPVQVGGLSKELTELERQVQEMQIHDPHVLQPGMTHVPSAESLRGKAPYSVDYTGNMNLPAYDSTELMYRADSRRINLSLTDRQKSDQVDEKYQSILESLRKSRLDAAKQKVQNRIDRRTAMAEEAARMEAAEAAEAAAAKLDPKAVAGGSISAQGDEATPTAEVSTTLHTAGGTVLSLDSDSMSKKNPRNINSNMRQLPYLDFNKFVTEWGRVLIDLATHLSAESGVKFFSLRNRKINASIFEYIATHYFKPWQMANLLRIDIVGMRLGPSGANVLSGLFSKCCRLVHLSLNGWHMGGAGLKKVLSAIIEGGGSEHLLRLELQENDITIALESFALIGEFSNLRALDLSKNCFTLDTTTQCRTFIAAISPLKKLQSLSVAYNKIQDAGCGLVCDLAKRHLPNIRLIDFAYCFLTKDCFRILNGFLRMGGSEEARTTNLDLEEIMLQGNVFSPNEEQEISEQYSNISRVKIDTFSKYIGIAFPLRYEMRDYGLEHYFNK